VRTPAGAVEIRHCRRRAPLGGNPGNAGRTGKPDLHAGAWYQQPVNERQPAGQPAGQRPATGQGPCISYMRGPCHFPVLLIPPTVTPSCDNSGAGPRRGNQAVLTGNQAGAHLPGMIIFLTGSAVCTGAWSMVSLILGGSPGAGCVLALVIVPGTSPAHRGGRIPRTASRPRDKESAHSSPLSTYSALGGLRQDPGGAA
jgi:hypothetical protein